MLIWVSQRSQCFKIRVAQHWGGRGHITVRAKVWGVNRKNFLENSREAVSVSTDVITTKILSPLILTTPENTITYHNALCLSPRILHKHCLQFLLGVKMAPRETENNAYPKCWSDRKRALWYVMVFSGVVNCNVWDQEIHTKKRESGLNLYYATLIFSILTLVISECSCDNLKNGFNTPEAFLFFLL